MTCHCGHELKAHGSGVQSVSISRTESHETPIWMCAYCNCVLKELPKETQGELFA